MLNVFPRPHDRWLKRFLKLAAVLLFVVAGINHFRHWRFYAAIVPPGFPSPVGLVIISGIAEIIGGVGLLIPVLRRAAGWGLIALLLAVFPANLYMAIAPDNIPDLHLPHWMLWLRLPLQGVLILWVWYVSLARARHHHIAL